MIVLAEGLAEYLPSEYLEGVPARRPRPHRHRAVQPGPAVRQAGRRRNTRSRPAQAASHRLAARLRGPLRPAARLRRDARQPARRRRLSGPGRKAARRRDGLGLRPARAELRAVREVGRSRHARDRGPLHRAGLRLPPAGTVPGNVRQSRRAGVDVTWDGSPEPTTAGSSHSRIGGFPTLARVC